MFESPSAFDLGAREAEAYQNLILPHVSRTFALTIPQLPPPLRLAVTNAYLLCRIADTIEDEPTFSLEQKRRYGAAFIAAVTGHIDSKQFSAELAPLFSQATLPAERELVSQLVLVLQITRSLMPSQRTAIINCLTVMSKGMFDFQRTVSRHGLETLRDMNRYCYCVAGVVGEMLTELLIDFDPALASQRGLLLPLAVSFGQGLQMTNVLKDQWEDYSHGVCWLPQDLFARHGVDLSGLQAGVQSANHGRALTEMIGIAHAHLKLALEYTLTIPLKHSGFRRFCVMNIAFAVLTLRKLQRHLDFCSGDQVKITHRAVAYAMALTRLSAHSNSGLRWLFKIATRRLPLRPLSAEWD
ncbi:phytoene/squalene synthase family protein [Pseudomonas sp. CCI3.2]|uniref:phytoene/squalene synthase family protein n=1 Tax=unclassified Pseudomonas TaxID=196821 RepID=UPI002AC915B7|nr:MULTISPECIES: phytoene/squalene synthase family protein [unclassified Pseudomonas]MEB0077695.1 phytoene/squalene synthase family protein [Pseudomonas sp. MH10out]MEB0090885.1 phytoene/squalene synthase family protein [Pseudomonas sp. CCI4.2]MEB0101311.1 phytoene/squalene synthase family protein [Pseudomonas sp. CCI3.2]MEB0131418.1 phytoene/squalene synthase family protein [Pseudomonas sp. CCI2.4]MEB0158428.1 phytoene/squalene synthase family protein [Pseudomonas sp. AH2 (2023)]